MYLQKKFIKEKKDNQKPFLLNEEHEHRGVTSLFVSGILILF